ncbi:hypothetical protein EC973_003873 [Apophysomyces ossiformis]|uniref:DUF7137 domain-containing protein n=1 Tax=Apophysomyces ossiformis TaxID=679940 RepID=A0A8H7EM38_9FUNG|nr:hypothetical protein EC973_003873 [Apophysomyces ossiformis]
MVRPHARFVAIFITLIVALAVLAGAIPSESNLVKRVPQAQGQPPPGSGSQSGSATPNPQNSPTPSQNPSGSPPSSGSQQPSGSPAASSGQQPSGSQQPSGNPSGSAPVNGTQPTNAPQSNNPNATANSVAGLPTSGSFSDGAMGGVTFLTPTSSKSVNPLFRIDPKENVTIVWQFTSLKVRPINLTLAAIDTLTNTYTIATMDGTGTSAVWHISDVPASRPLMAGYYTIQLYDQRGPTPPAPGGGPGWFDPRFAKMTIAFYLPQSYSPYSDRKQTVKRYEFS